MPLRFPKTTGCSWEDQSPREVEGELGQSFSNLLLPDFPSPVAPQTLLCPLLPGLPRHLCRAGAGWSTGRGGRAHR